LLTGVLTALRPRATALWRGLSPPPLGLSCFGSIGSLAQALQIDRVGDLHLALGTVAFVNDEFLLDGIDNVEEFLGRALDLSLIHISEPTRPY